MKCLACDCILNNREATRKYATSRAFVDLCDDCFETIKDEVEIVENNKLTEEESYE